MSCDSPPVFVVRQEAKRGLLDGKPAEIDFEGVFVLEVGTESVQELAEGLAGLLPELKDQLPDLRLEMLIEGHTIAGIDHLANAAADTPMMDNIVELTGWVDMLCLFAHVSDQPIEQ